MIFTFPLIVLIVAVVLLQILYFFENFSLSWLTFIIIAIFCIFAKTPISSFLILPQTYYIGLPLYLIIGVLWSFFKWYRYMKVRLLNEKAVGRLQDKDRLQAIVKPEWDKIVYWISYWPFSFTGDVLKFIFRDMTLKIAKMFTKIYEGISNYTIKTILKQ